MKKLLTILMLLAASLPLWAYDFEINGLYYNKTGSSLQLTYASESYNSYSGDIVIPSTVSHDGTSYDVTQIGMSAFRNCTGLTSVTIPSTVEFIGTYAFYGCTALTEITIPNSVTQLGGYLFAFSTALESVTLPESTYELTAFIFEGCTALTQFTIPSGVKRVVDNAFDYCEALTSITIPAGVTEVKAGAFDGCSALTTIIVDENNTVYDSRNNCNAIIETATNTLIAGCQSTVIPNDVTAIGIAAFNGHTGLTSITIPNSVTSIGGIAFEDCTGLTSITLGNGVTSIGNNAFDGCTGLKSLIIPNSVTSIGSKAFYGCTGMTEVTISENVALIDETTFAHCTGLTDVTIPNGVSSIGISAFEGCTGLTNLTIPNSVTSISTCAFLNCNKLSTITCNATTPPTVESSSTFENYNATVYVPIKSYYKYKNDSIWGQFNIECVPSNLYYKITSNTTVEVTYKDANYNSYSGDIYIPSTTVIDGVTYSVTKIGTNAFQNCIGLTFVIIPNSITSIGDNAFNGCNGLTEITIPNSITIIGNSAFYGCSRLTEITIPNSVTSMSGRAFYGCTGLTKAIIGNGVTSISFYAFYGCSKMTEVIIGNSVTSIGSNAFSYCTGLTEITIPNSVTSIGGDAFSYCTGLTEVTIPNSVTSIGERAFYGCTGLTKLPIGNSVSTIGKYAYEGCNNIKDWIIPASVTSIDDRAFPSFKYNFNREYEGIVLGTEPCIIKAGTFQRSGHIILAPLESLSKYENAEYWNRHSYIANEDNYFFALLDDGTLEIQGVVNKPEGSLIIPDKVTKGGIIYKISSISHSAFTSCTGLTEVTIPNSITNIGSGAFAGCTGLTSITIPNSVTSIGGSAFSGCTGLTEIVIPDSVTSIGGSAFKGCTGLTSITIPNSVISIGDNAFSGCTGLTSITIPNSVTSIGGDAFNNCTISNIYFDDIAAICNGVWSALPRASAISLYHNGELVTELVIPDGITSIGNNAFQNCTGLTSVTIPNSVETISNNAFQNCTGLTSVTISNGVETISNNAFRNCTGLTEITIPDSVTSIGTNAFAGCTSLTSVIIGNGVTSIGNGAFSDCTGLTKVTIGNSVTSIGNYAFISCTKLTSITIPNSVTSIGDRAFYECGRLDIIMQDGEKEVTLGERAFTFINTLFMGRTLSYSYPYSYSYTEYGFYGHTTLTEVTIGNNVTMLDEYLFGNCTNLYGEIVLPASLDSIANNAFASTNYSICRSMATVPPSVANAKALGKIKTVIIPTGSRAAYEAANVWKDLAIIEDDPECEIEITVSEPGNLSVDILLESDFTITPQMVTKLKLHGTINEEDFNHMRIAMTSCYSIDLSDANCVALPDSAFEGKYYLTELILPNNCESIGNNAFKDCSALTSLVIPETVASLGSSAFNGCSSLKSINIPKALTEIKDSTFGGCSNLREITIPANITTIKDNAFVSCNRLQKLTIEDGSDVLYLGHGPTVTENYLQRITSLFEFTALNSVYIGRDIKPLNTSSSLLAFKGVTSIKTVTYGNQVTATGSEAFKGCTGLKTVKIGSNVTQISYGSFSGCTNLTNVYLGKSVSVIGTAFDGCSSLKYLDVEDVSSYCKIEFGSAVNSLSIFSISGEGYLYSNGELVTHIDIPEDVTTVKNRLFLNMVNIESVNIPENVTSISLSSFEGCTGLKSVTLPKSLTSIGNQAFKRCTSLTTVNLSDSLKTIGNEAFYDCEALANITCPALVPPTVGTDGFEGVNNYTCILTIPGESLMDYAKVAEWVAFFQKRKRIDVEVDTPVVDEEESDGESESGSEGDSNNGKGHFCGGHIWYDRDWHKHHGGHHAPRRYAAAEEPVAVNGIDATIGDGLSLFIATDSVVSFLIEPEEGYAIGSVRYGGVDVTNQLNNGVFTTSAVSANTTLEVSFVEGDAPVVTVMLGDANNDAVVFVSYILGDESAVASLVNADANEDGVINVADVVSTVNIILSQGVQAAPMRYEGGKGLLAMNDLVIAHGETAGIEVSLDNEVPYTAFQMDVTLPDGLTVNDIALSNRLNATHSMMWRMQDDNTLRVVVFAVDNSAVADNSGALFTIEVTADAAFEGGNIVADNAIFTVRDLTIHHLDTAVAGAKNTAGVDGIYTADRIYTMGRTIVIESTCDQVAYITTTGGVMRAEEVKAGRNEITLSQQGLYIVVVGSETQKVIIR